MIWQLALDSVKAGEKTTLVAVVEHQGSVPGKSGAVMIVTPSSVAGTVGGGLVEHQWINRARKLENPILAEFSHDGVSTDSVCSGLQIMVGLPLKTQDLPTIQRLTQMAKTGEPGLLKINPDGIELEVWREDSPGVFRNGHTWTAKIQVGRPDELFIAGGGHVSLALSRIMSTLPFRIEVFDTRPDLPTMKNNSWAHATKTVDWDDVADELPEGPHSWAVIMTHGHRDDEEVLRKILHLDLRYLGLMGSATKVALLFRRMKTDGVDPRLLEKVHAPIGLQIGSHTPEEIAISIAAEIIRIRNGFAK